MWDDAIRGVLRICSHDVSLNANPFRQLHAAGAMALVEAGLSNCELKWSVEEKAYRPVRGCVVLIVSPSTQTWLMVVIKWCPFTGMAQRRPYLITHWQQTTPNRTFKHSTSISILHLRCDSFGQGSSYPQWLPLKDNSEMAFRHAIVF